MKKKIKKIILYSKALYKGELLKRIEYKLKDSLYYFYFRNKLQNKKNIYSINGININSNLLDIIDIPEVEEQYRIFNDKVVYTEIINFLESNTDKEFWRKVKLNKHEDIKIIWEYNRLQFLLPLVVKFLKTGDKQYKIKVQEILQKWSINNPFEYTLNWNSNLEVAIRALNIGLSILLLKDEAIDRQYANLLYLHGIHIYNDISYSEKCIPNNHVIGEAVALMFLSCILETKMNKKWYKKSIKIIEKYIDTIDDNGFSKENSFSYQFFVTKMYILSLCFIKDKELFEKINNKIIFSLDVLKKTAYNDENIINYGDNDNGFLFSIFSNYNIVKDIEQYYNLFFKKELTDETILYMHMQQYYNKFNNIKYGEINPKEYIVTKHNFIYNNKNVVLFFNAKPISGHAHNDSLAISLIIKDKEILLDAGTYSYNKDVDERKYFRSREAHTTILFKEDNAIQVGTFRWINVKNSFINLIDDNNEYIKIQGEVADLGKRQILIYKNRKEIEIIDTNISESQLMTNWLVLSEAIQCEKEIVINNTKIKYDAQNIEHTSVDISKRYLEKERADCYRVTCNKKLNTKIVWE